MKKYTYLINNDAQTLARVGEPMAVRGDSGVAEVEFIIPSGFVINPTEALWRAYYRLPGKREAHFVTLPTPTATESGDWTTTWTVTHAVTQSAGRLAFSLTAFSGETVQWDSRVAILQINESVYDGESEESEEPYIGRLATLEGDMAQIRGEWEGVQDEFDDLKEVATAGVPVAVEEAADMINDGHIYIYTGTEPGYTARHVYYYVDGTMTDGGVYGGANIDTTLTVSGAAADAKVVGSKLGTTGSKFLNVDWYVEGAPITYGISLIDSARMNYRNSYIAQAIVYITKRLIQSASEIVAYVDDTEGQLSWQEVYVEHNGAMVGGDATIINGDLALLAWSDDFIVCRYINNEWTALTDEELAAYILSHPFAIYATVEL